MRRVTQLQDAKTLSRGVQDLQRADVPAAQPVPVVGAPLMMPNTRRHTQQQSRHQRAFLQCAQCGADPHAYTGHTDSGLMGHHGAQESETRRPTQHIQESVAQLRQLDRAACVTCGTIQSRLGNRCEHYRTDTAIWKIVVGIWPRSATAKPSGRHHESTPLPSHQWRSQPIPQGEPPE